MSVSTTQEQSHQLLSLCAAVVFLISARLIYGLVVDHAWVPLGVVLVKCLLVGGLLYLLPRLTHEDRSAEMGITRNATIFLVLLTMLSMTADLAVGLLVH